MNENVKDFEGRGRGLISRSYLGIHLEGLRKTMEKLHQDSQALCRDLNPRPLEYKAGVLTTRPQHSAE
jgi:hypothetical protein